MKKILVATDFSPIATAAVRFAGKLAEQTQSELTALYADTFEPPAEFTSREVGTVATAIDTSQRRAQEELERCLAQNVPPTVTTHAAVIEAPAVTAIVNYARQSGAEIIVVGTHARKGLDRLLLGSVAERVVVESPVPVLIVPPRSA